MPTPPVFPSKSSRLAGRWWLVTGAVLVALLTVIAGTGVNTAAAQPPSPAAQAARQPTSVDESALVPALSPTFVPWTCRATLAGPVCRGERHLRPAVELTDLPCRAPLWNRYQEDRYQTRYYGRDNLNYFRTFHTTNVDYFGTSADDTTLAVIRTDAGFYETFDVRGNDQTISITTIGVIWDLRDPAGQLITRAVGVLNEPHQGTPTFTGSVIKKGVRSHFVDAPADTMLGDDNLLALACDAAVGN